MATWHTDLEGPDSGLYVKYEAESCVDIACGTPHISPTWALRAVCVTSHWPGYRGCLSASICMFCGEPVVGDTGGGGHGALKALVTTPETPRLGEGHRRRLRARETTLETASPRRLPRHFSISCSPLRSPGWHTGWMTTMLERRTFRGLSVPSLACAKSVCSRARRRQPGVISSGACRTTAVHMTRGPANEWVGGGKVYPMSELCTRYPPVL